jgi:tRNA (mo5U34)-methyltransferase
MTADIQSAIASVPHWYHRIELAPGVVTPGVNDSPKVLSLLGLPEDCRGARALDIGTRDGFFAFELERRGADVLGVDYVAKSASGFAVASEILRSRVVYLQENIYNLDPKKIGAFDIVLFLGLLYHLPEPLSAIHLVRSLSRNLMYLESHVTRAYGDEPVMRYLQRDLLNNDPTNFWAPNVACLKDMLLTSEFKVERVTELENRAIIRCVTGDDAFKRGQWQMARGEKLP